MASPITGTPYLPEEILQLIFEQLKISLDRKGYNDKRQTRATLATACLASKQCRRLAQPVLYHTIDLESAYGEDEKFYRLSDTLARSSFLSGLVHELKVEYWDFRPGTDLDPFDDGGTYETKHMLESSRPEFERAMGSMRDFVHPIRSTRSGTLLQAAYAGSLDAHLAFILTQCRNLERLGLTIPVDFDESWVSAVLEHAAAMCHLTNASAPSGSSTLASGSLLPCLKQFDTEHWDTENATDITDISDILGITTLTKYHGFAVDVTPGENPLKIKPYTLEKIELLYSIIDGEGLARLLSCCPKLSSLSIEWGGATVGDCEISWDAIGTALREHGRGMKRLQFDYTHSMLFEQGDDEPVHPPLGDLKPLTSLTYLEVPAVALFGQDDDLVEGYPHFELPILADNLPASLKTLKIMQWGELDEEMHDEDVLKKSLIGALVAESRLQNLSTVRIQGSQFTAEDFEEVEGWRVSLDNQFWVVLKKKQQQQRDTEAEG
ncbi:hypothetical protein FE78DRAFT_85107 [Lecanosticta acicola]|uniref:Uncharacterized protein n=1 Tax=Lecanosticta acicola TaxID=111012 RepID=A0AAI9EEP6_9PEZI|nr:hypothetical protein FE78DRAFT_85107 [Lecanosticta acicola]